MSGGPGAVAECERCGQSFSLKVANKRFCSPLCRNRTKKERENANLRSARQLRYTWGIVRCGNCGCEFDNRIPYESERKPTVPRRFCSRHCQKRHTDTPSRDRVRRLAKYGLTVADYEEMHDRQDGLCAICRKPESAVRHGTGGPLPLHVDHSHVTGEVRGLLCRSCNTFIGLANEDADVLRAAIHYLALSEGETDDRMG